MNSSNGDGNNHMGASSGRSQAEGGHVQEINHRTTAPSSYDRVCMLLDSQIESMVRSRFNLPTALPQYNVEQPLAVSQMGIFPNIDHGIDAPCPWLPYQFDSNFIQPAPLQLAPSSQTRLNFDNLHMPHNDLMSLTANTRLNEARTSIRHDANYCLASHGASTSSGFATGAVHPTTMPLVAHPPSSYRRALIDKCVAVVASRGGFDASRGYSGFNAAAPNRNMSMGNDQGFGTADQEQRKPPTSSRVRNDSRTNIRNDNPSKPTSSSADNGIATSSALSQDEEKHPRTLEISSDSTFLDPVHAFIRARCIEVFAATQEDVAAPGRGVYPSKVGRVGLRCCYCKGAPKDNIARQAVCFPSKRETIFESVRNFMRTHMKACHCIPPLVQSRYKSLTGLSSKKKRSHKYLKAYYAESASELGIVDTCDGLMFGAPPNETGIPSHDLQAILDAAEDPSLEESYWASQSSTSENERAIGLKKFEHVSSESTRRVIINARKEPSLLVYPEDFPSASDFDFILFHQVTPFVPSTITLGREDKHTKGKAFGLCCKHCVHAGEGKNHFPVQLNSLADARFLKRMLSHFMKCPHVSQELKDAFDELNLLAGEYCVKAKRGSVKRLIEKVWERLRNYYGMKTNLKQQAKR